MERKGKEEQKQEKAIQKLRNRLTGSSTALPSSDDKRRDGREVKVDRGRMLCFKESVIAITFVAAEWCKQANPKKKEKLRRRKGGNPGKQKTLRTR